MIKKVTCGSRKVPILGWICGLNLLFIVSGSGAADPCVSWFKNTGVTPGIGCKARCLVAKIDLDSFFCHDECDQLCRKGPSPSPTPYYDALLRSLVVYPGLTPSEKDLVLNHPKEAFTVFLQKNIAEKSTSRNFPEGLVDDESDAYRHFIWSGLLLKELGRARAKVFLDAHESGAIQSSESKSMDLANNETALTAAENLLLENRLNLPNLEKEALSFLREHKLVVLKPGREIPKEPVR